MSGILAAYLRRRVMTHALALTGILTALMQVLELMDVTTDALDRGLGMSGLIYYAALRAPAQLVLALPLAALLGAMSAFHEMRRNNEIFPIRSSGISLRRFVLYILPVPLLLSLAQLALSQSVVPGTEAALKNWWDATAPVETEPARAWVRTNAGPVSYARAAPDGQELTRVSIYRRGEDGKLSTRVSARSAKWGHDGWRLEDIEELRVADGLVTRSTEASRVWKTNLQPHDVSRLNVARPHLSSIMLVDVITGERVGTQPRSYYETALYRSLVAPLAAFIMLLLALPTARGLPRDGSERGLLIALGLGLAFLLCDGLMASLGSSGRVPALAAALAAPALFATIGLLHLIACERR